MGTYSALGPTIKEAVEKLKKEHQLDRVLRSVAPQEATAAELPKKKVANEHR